VSSHFIKYIQIAVYVVYSLALGLAFLFVVPAYFVRLRVLKREPLHLAERLGLKARTRPSDSPCLWIHAVSVGEVLSLQNLVHSLKAKHPGWEIAFSTLTNTGYRMAASKLRDVDHLFFVPFDFARPVRRVIRSLRPDLLVLAESEFWPRLLREAKRAGVPMLVVNGRISERTGRRLKRLRVFARPLLKNVDSFLVQSARDGERLKAAGVSADRLSVSGNLKCETRLPAYGPDAVRAFKAELSLSPDHKVLVAGSIHPGEDERLGRAFREARARRSDLVLVLAPRHPDKFDNVERIFSNGAFVVRRKSKLEPGQSWDVLILDTFGELTRFYALADVAFIGGSLVPWGGQNLLEPAYYGKPIFFGPHMKNFADLADTFVQGGAAKVVASDRDLEEMFQMADPDGLRRIGERARAILTSLQGATDITLAAIEGVLGHGQTR
jgi:3-deoxy-D-manno-octulosonic-acid transferase